MYVFTLYLAFNSLSRSRDMPSRKLLREERLSKKDKSLKLALLAGTKMKHLTAPLRMAT
jgi:hypothetical protein